MKKENNEPEWSKNPPTAPVFVFTEANRVSAAKAILGCSDETQLKAWHQEESMGRGRKGHLGDLEERLAQLGPKSGVVKEAAKAAPKPPARKVVEPMFKGLELTVYGQGGPIVIHVANTSAARSVFKRGSVDRPQLLKDVDGIIHLVMKVDRISITKGIVDASVDLSV